MTERTPKEMAGIYFECLEAVTKTVPRTLLVDKDMSTAQKTAAMFTSEDYRVMASSVMIAYRDQFKKQFGGRSGGGDGGSGKDPNRPCTAPQIKKIETEQMKLGKKGDNILGQFLDNVGKPGVGNLTVPEASSLIDLLMSG